MLHFGRKHACHDLVALLDRLSSHGQMGPAFAGHFFGGIPPGDGFQED